MSEKMKFKRDPKIIFREEGDIGLLFNPDNGRVNILNETGKFIWAQLAQARTKSRIAEGLKDEFDIPDEETAEDDVNSFISSLGRAGLLEDYVDIPKFPSSVCFGITSKCNFNCKHCLNRNLPVSGPDMTTDELEAVIDQMAECGTRSVSLFGGEPLIHQDFKRIVGCLNRRLIGISLNTNGSLIDDDMAEWLKANNVKSAVVSFDGSKASVMDEASGEGAFAMSARGIKALGRAGVSVLLSVTLTKLNYKDVKDMVLLGREINGRSIRFNHVFYGGNAACFAKELYLSPREEQEAIDAVWRAKDEFGDFVSGESSYLCQKRKLEKVGDHKGVHDKVRVGTCGAGTAKCAIRPDGHVTPCEILWDVKCGNVREERLKSIWEDSPVMNAFRKPLEVDLEDMPECKGCRYQYICFLGHRCYPYHNPGGVANRDLYCWLKKS
jgi:radical SAM protein with 4Fe4S-binding SPASM domain